MKKVKLLFLMLLLLVLNVNAQERRPIDNRHPMWMIHIDVWNNADPQKIIDLIPSDIKPYVCLNLSMSCAYDTSLKIYKKPQDAIQTYKSWASVCCRNNMWFTCQPASGGHTHIPDNAANFNKALKYMSSSSRITRTSLVGIMLNSSGDLTNLMMQVQVRLLTV